MIAGQQVVGSESGIISRGTEPPSDAHGPPGLLVGAHLHIPRTVHGPAQRRQPWRYGLVSDDLWLR